MNRKFLEIVADQIFTYGKEEIAKTTVILPNRRAAIFLQKHLAAKSTQTFWLPRIISIEDFVFEAANYQKASSTDLIFELYETYLHFGGSGERSFEDFGSFGPLLLKDFNDIDNYLADAQVIFTFLKEARALQKWNPNDDDSGQIEKSFLQFYSNLIHYYRLFKTKLSEQKIAYYGMAIRTVIEAELTKQFVNNQYIIAGFNAISNAEEKLFELLSFHSTALIMIDADDHYLDNPIQESGKHLHKVLKNNKLKIKLIKNNGFKTGKTIKIKGISGEIGMAKLAGQTIDNFIKSNDFVAEETAIILPDEKLLFPLISALPQEIKEMNITMSYPFSKTNGYDLVLKTFELYESAYRNTHKKAFHYAAMIDFLNNTLITKSFVNYSKLFINKIHSENLNYLSQQAILEINNELYQEENPNPTSILNLENQDSLTVIDSIINLLIQIESKPMIDVFERSILAENRQILFRLKEKLQKYNINERPRVLLKIFQSMANFSGISFEGKPLAGLQIMGVLETRNLDFDRIIYLSFNEGLIPTTKTFKSYILPEIRYHFGLPMPADDDAISAYHFYRSIQRAKEVILIYNVIPGVLGGGEMSRFGRQILHELDHKINKIEQEIIQFQPPIKHIINEILIEKNDNIIRILKEIGTESDYGFSPSSLLTYLKCPLSFYFRYILHVKPMQEVEEEIAINTRGSAIHETLETIYKREAESNNKFGEVFFTQAKKVFSQLLNEAYARNYKQGDTEHGYNLILKKLDEKMVRDFIVKDSIYSTGTSEVKTEEELIFEIPIICEPESLKIKLRGSADRIDYMNSVRRIIDYKTGKVEEKELKINNKGENGEIWTKIFEKGQNQKTFQLLMYSYLYLKSHPTENQVLPVIAALKTQQIFHELKPTNGYIDNGIIDEFEIELNNLLQNIYDRNIPFSQTTDNKRCKFCDYKESCGR